MRAIEEATMQKLMADIGGDPEVMQDLVQTFLAEGPRIMDALRESVRSNDRRSLNRAAHSLKSTAATFGAANLSRLCRDLEKVSETEWPADAAARAKAIEEEWGLVRADLASWKPIVT